MSTGIGCALYLDGDRVADGRDGDSTTAPTALSGLSVVWGRSTTVDQPEASTCQFQVWNRDPGNGAAAIFTPGAPVQVYAEGMTFPDPDTSTFLDPGFEGGDLGNVTVSHGLVDITTDQASEGTHSLRVRAIDYTGPTVLMAPAPFVPAGTDPDAWDAIPTTEAGQSWSVALDVWPADGQAIGVRLVGFTHPWANSWQALSPWVRVYGDPRTWTTHRIDNWPMGTSGLWVGVQVDAWPQSEAWQDVEGTWEAPSFGTTWRWQDAATNYVDNVQLLAPGGGTATEVLVFDGRISSVVATAGDHGPQVDVVATDFTADLDNRDVGDEPWTVETMEARFNRVVGLAGLDVTTEIDPALAPILLSYQDVDAQGAMGLLRDFATSVDGVLWPAVHRTTGPYLLVEDTRDRPSVRMLEWDGTYVVVVSGGATGYQVSACDILADPVSFVRDASEVSTRVAVSWLEQGTDDDGQPTTTEHTETAINTELEAVWGTRRIGITTLLQAAADAEDVAGRVLARTDLTGWRAEGLTVDDDLLETAADALLEFRLLDGTQRIGAPLLVTDLPAWSPVGGDLALYVEGGTYTFPEGGGWVLDLTVSPSQGIGESVAWDEMDPTWTWAQMDPGMTWQDLIGTSGPQEET